MSPETDKPIYKTALRLRREAFRVGWNPRNISWVMNRAAWHSLLNEKNEFSFCSGLVNEPYLGFPIRLEVDHSETPLIRLESEGRTLSPEDL